MARIFVTGSSTGLGLMAAELLCRQGHQVILHARDEARSRDTLATLPTAEAVVEGDLSTIAGAKQVADQVNRLGAVDAVIHNAGIGYRETKLVETEDGVPLVFAVNTLAPYVLTTLIRKPKRLVFVSSGMHRGAEASLNDLVWKRRKWHGATAYAESKLHDVLLAFAVARRWPDVRSNAMEPGWVATRMGGEGATDDLRQAHLTQAWLAGSDDPAAEVTGKYFYHMKPRETHPSARDEDLQDRLMEACWKLSGIPIP